MIRYNKSIIIRRLPSGTYTITGDRSAVGYKTSAIHGYEQVRIWWERQHQSDLREYQKNFLVQMIPGCFRDTDYEWSATPYVVYAEGEGYNQPHDICFVTLQHSTRSKTVYLLGTQDHTWIHTENTSVEKFNLHCEDAYPGASTAQGKDALWDLYDNMRGLTL